VIAFIVPAWIDLSAFKCGSAQLVLLCFDDGAGH